MSVLGEIERLEGAKSALAASITGKGVTVPEGTKIDGMAALVDQISTGGGGADFYIDDASYLFYNKARLDCLEDVLGLIRNAKSTSHMFYGCTGIYDIYLDEVDLSSVKSMDYMFHGCSNVSKIDFGQGAVIKPSNCGNMFYNCSSLTKIILSELDTSEVTNMANMFYQCSSLKNEALDFSQFSTLKANNMSGMFYRCLALKSINLQNFDTSNVLQMNNFLESSTNLEEIMGFSFVGAAGGHNLFPYGFSASNKSKLKRLTFKTIQQEGKYSIRSAINVKWCSFARSGMVEMFGTLPDISGLTLNASYKQITITGNPCVTDGTLTDEDKAIAIGKGWTIVI